MIECPNCGGNLKFDIASQQMKCEYCLSTHDPYEVSKDKDAEESHDFNVTVFTCPQCGGEILSTDTSVAEFCSFCGASTILDSRISNEKKPARIIPFQQTKDACKEAYFSKIKKALFAPDALKDKKYIDSFRGIYMPYWVYNISQQGTVHLNGKKSYRKGNYIYTDYYDMKGDIDAYYNNLSYDASSSFSDNISQQITPYHIKGEKEFSPAFLSGFYADTADVSSDIYQADAIKIANTTSYNKVKKTAEFSGISFSSNNNFQIASALHTCCGEPERVMYPVWFMSYRKGNRISYATVNGQTGKVAADIPVDIKKYVFGSLILAVPIFIILNFFFTLKPTTLLGCSTLLAIITAIIYLTEVSSIYHQDKRHDDRGYQYLQSMLTADAGRKKTDNKISFGELMKYSQLSNHFKLPGFAGSLAAIILSGLIWLFNPVSDLWYYGGALTAFVGILLTVASIINKYNILATRELPQFNRRGGDDNA